MIGLSFRWVSRVVLLSCLLPGALFAQDEAPPQDSEENGRTQEPEGSDPPETEEEDLEEKAPRRAGEVIVTASRRESEIFESTQGVNVINSRELEERQPRTPAEALRYQPGIWVQKTGHIGGAPILRGFMGNQVVYLFDGIRRNTAGIFAGPNSFLQNIDAMDVDRIEVIRGPGSVLYGSDAIGGVINVISNEQPEFPDEWISGGRTRLRFASVDNEKSIRQEGYLATPDFYVFAGGTYRDIDALSGGRDVGLQEPAGWYEADWDAQFDWRISQQQQLGFFIQDVNREHVKRFDRPTQTSDTDRELYGLRYRGQELGPFDALEATLYFHDQESGSRQPGSHGKDNDETVGFEVQATSDVTDKLSLVYGAHFHRDRVTSRDDLAGSQDPSVQWDNAAAFLLSELQVSDRVRIDVGLRWDRFRFTSDAPAFFKLPSGVQDAIDSGSFSLGDLEVSETDDALTGGIGAVVGLTDEINWFGHVGRAFRAPNKSDQLSFGQFTFGFGVPSGDLDPESSWTFETGLRAATSDFSGAVTGFYTIVEDGIVSNPGTFNGSPFVDVDGDGVQDPDEGVFVKSNTDKDILAWGFELEGVYEVPMEWTEPIVSDNPVSAYGNFSWIYGKDLGSDQPLDRAYPANGLFGLRVENDRDPSERDWWVESEAWMVRKMERIPIDRLTADPAFKVDPQDRTSPLLRSDGSVPGFSIFNLRGGVHLSDHATLIAAVENLTDRKYRVKDSRIDAPGINFILGFEFLYRF